MLRTGAAISAAAMLLATASPTAAQEQVEQGTCSEAHVAGDWRLDVSFANDSFEGDSIRYTYSHQPSDFRMTMRVVRQEGVVFGYDIAGLFDAPGIDAYFEEMPTEPYDPDAVFPPDYLGTLDFAVANMEQGWVWRTSGQLAYGFDPYVQDANWIFSVGEEQVDNLQERIRSLIRNLTDRKSDALEFQLEFTPDGGRAQVLRRLAFSTDGLVELANQSGGYVQGIMQRCPAAQRG